MIDWFNNAVASDVTVLFLADTIAKATLLLMLSTLTAAVGRRASAAVHHRLWTLTLCGLLVIPMFSWIIPGWGMPLWPATADVAETPSAMDRSPVTPARDEARPEVAKGAESEVSKPVIAEMATRQERLPDRFAEQKLAAEPPSANTFIEAGRSTGGTDARWTAGSWLSSVWMAGLLLAAFPTLLGLFANERRRARSRSVIDSDWNQLIETSCRKLGIRGCVDVRESAESIIPLTWGVMRPVILLPAEARNWPVSLRRLVLLHELAHIRRHDVVCQLAGRLAAACYWFHPLAWYALHRLRVECEYACDDRVVLCGERPTEYAGHLLELARSLRAPRFDAAVGMARRNALDNRFQALFDDTRSHLPLTAQLSGLLLASATGLAFALAAVHSGIAAAEPKAPVKTPLSEPATPAPEKKTEKTAEEKIEAAPETALGSTKKLYPVTVTGQALDPTGKPIAGAKIYLGSCAADWKRIAETTTDAAGRYLFEKVDLPIEPKNVNNGLDVGAFEVFGQARGFGFAWRPRATYFPVPRSESGLDSKSVTTLDPRERFAADDEIELDLTFSAPSTLSGRIVDERGNPIPETRLAIRFCEPLEAVPGRHALAFTTLNETATVPAEMKLRTSDADGRFEFAGLPINCRFRIDVRPPKFPSRQVWGATTTDVQHDYQGAPVHIGELRLEFVTPLEIPVQVLLGDSDEPAAKVFVDGWNQQNDSNQTTDGLGRATLRLPPGEYRLHLLPAFGTPYLPSAHDHELDRPFVINDLPSAKPIVARLRPAAIIEVTVEDQTTGKGLPNVDVWQVVAPPARPGRPPHRELVIVKSFEAVTRISHHDSPRTDPQGKVRVFVEPGVHTIGVGLESFPETHFVVEPDGKSITCAAGETVQVRFAMQNFDAQSQSGVAVLDQLTAVNFTDSTPEDALKYLARRHKLTLKDDQDLLRVGGAPRRGPRVDLKLHGVPLRSILQDLLEPIRLDYVIDDDMLVITTRENAAARRQVIAETDKADDRLTAIIKQVAASEGLYKNLEARITTHYDIGDRKPFGGNGEGLRKRNTEIVRKDFTTHFVSQNGMFRLETRGSTFNPDGPGSRRDIIQLFDGETNRIVQRYESDPRQSAVQDYEVVRPHTLLLRYATMNGSFSEYLRGGRPNWMRGLELKVEYQGVAEHQGLKCQLIRATTIAPSSGRVSTVSEWWLAESRNFLPVRRRHFSVSNSSEIPALEGEVEKLRELKPGIWFPERAEVRSFDTLELKRTGKQDLQWREQYTLSNVSLAPDYGKEFFQDDRVTPKDLSGPK
ncbi:MAG TPA: M56 family metallopeptidase [Planctomycetaceae bacterium]|jgi:beta-lactamase regulating signal transducer with metallopeptidase domain